VKERTILTIVLLTLVVLVVGYLVATNVDLMPTAASSRAVLVDELSRVLVGISTVVFLVVEGALLYAVLRFRKKRGDEEDAVPMHGNNTLELVWTIIPAFIVVFIGFYSFRILTDIEARSADEMVVEVIGQQFVWSFRYPDYDLTTQELRLPIGKPVRFEITSLDVIHSFWVPEFRAKRDATPGLIADLVITPTKLGSFPIRCAELCGAGHANMVSTVTVTNEEDFLSWIEVQSSLPVVSLPQPTSDEPDSGDPPEDEPTESPSDVMELGRDLFGSVGCAACHTLADASATGLTGPILDGISETAKTREDNVTAHDYIQKSILAPNSFVVDGFPASLMPHNYEQRMTEEELEILVEYLLHQ
jgi:cytochrome c oxidase subunit 2